MNVLWCALIHVSTKSYICNTSITLAYLFEEKDPCVVTHTALWCNNTCTPVMSQNITVQARAPCQWQWHHPPQNTDWQSKLASFSVVCVTGLLQWSCLAKWLKWLPGSPLGVFSVVLCHFQWFSSLLLHKRKTAQLLKIGVIPIVPHESLEIVLCLKPHLRPKQIRGKTSAFFVIVELMINIVTLFRPHKTWYDTIDGNNWTSDEVMSSATEEKLENDATRSVFGNNRLFLSAWSLSFYILPLGKSCRLSHTYMHRHITHIWKKEGWEWHTPHVVMKNDLKKIVEQTFSLNPKYKKNHIAFNVPAEKNCIF